MPRALPWVVGVLSSAALDAAAEAERRPTGPNLFVRLAWTEPAGIMAGGWFQAAEETSRVLARLGLQAQSRSAPVSEPLSPDEIRVILLPGAGPTAAAARNADEGETPLPSGP